MAAKRATKPKSELVAATAARMMFGGRVSNKDFASTRKVLSGKNRNQVAAIVARKMVGSRVSNKDYDRVYSRLYGKK